MAEKNFTGVNQKETSETDINDLFDSIAFSEDLISNDSFQEGFIKGKKDGTFEGYHLGFHKGFALGTEIGIYKGLTKVLNNNFGDFALEKNEKIQSSLKKLIHLLDSFSEHNRHDVDIVKKINDIRANFRKLNSLLKLNMSFPTTSVTSF